MLKLSDKWTSKLAVQPETGMGYQIADVILKDGTINHQTIIVEGQITEIKGLKNIPFSEEQINEIILTHDKWDFVSSREQLLYKEFLAFSSSKTVYLGDLPVAVLNGQDDGRGRGPNNPVFYIIPDQLGSAHIITNEWTTLWNWDPARFGSRSELSYTVIKSAVSYRKFGHFRAASGL